MVFVGGAIVELLITDPAAPPLRGGKDGAVSGTFAVTFEVNAWRGTWTSASKDSELPVTMSRVGDVADWLGGQIGGWVCDRQHPALEDGDEAESATSEDE